MAELFGIDKSGISRHLAKIFESGELDEEVVVAKIATTTQHGAMQDKTQTIPTNYYNLDAIISVGYRVNSIQATRSYGQLKSILRMRGFFHAAYLFCRPAPISLSVGARQKLGVRAAPSFSISVPSTAYLLK